jgi:photosystem II stability/assembly factor-like uncharacterized protein
MVACLSPNGPTVYRGDSPPRRLYVGSRSGVSILQRTAPDAPWRVAGRALDGRHVSAIMAAPDGSWLAAGCHDGGFYFSGDAGRSWERRSDGLTIDHVFSLASTEPADAPTFYLGTQPVSLFRSRDFGRHWQELPALARVPGTDKWTFPDPRNTSHTKCIAIDSRHPARLYVAVEQGGLFRSEDAGATWRELDSYYRPGDRWYRDIHRIVPIESDPDRLYMTTGMGLYASADAGETWEHLTDPECRVGYPDHLVASPRDPRILFMSGARHDPTEWHASHYANGTVLASRDGGRSWSAADIGLPEERRANIEAMCIACYPTGFSLFAGNTDGEVFECEDGDGRWSRIAEGLGAISKLGHFRLVEANASV